MKKNKLILTALAAAMLVSPMAKVGAEEVTNPVQNEESAKDVYKVTINYKLGETVIKTETKSIKKGEKLNLDPSSLNVEGKSYKFKANFVIPVINQDGVVIDVPVTETISATAILNNAVTRYNVTVVYQLGDTPLTAVPALVEKDKEIEVSDFVKEGKTYHVPNDYKKVKATVNHQVVIVPVQEIEADKEKKDEDLHIHVSYTLKGQEVKREYKLAKKGSKFNADLTELNKGEKKYEVSKEFKAPDVIMENQLITVPVEEKKAEDGKQVADVTDVLGKLDEKDINIKPLNPTVVDEIKDIVKEEKKDEKKDEPKEEKKEEGSKVHDALAKLDEKDVKLDSLNKEVVNEVKDELGKIKEEEKKEELGSKVHDALSKLDEKDVKLDVLNKEVVEEIRKDFKDYPLNKSTEEVKKNEEVKKANPKDELVKTGITTTGIGSGVLGIVGMALSFLKKRK